MGLGLASGVTLPARLASWPSMDTTAENAQQEPQVPWFFTSATRPLARQSTAAGTGAPEGLCVWVDHGVSELRVLADRGL